MARARIRRCSPVLGVPLTADDALVEGRESFRRRAWADAYAQLSAADHVASLEATDLERLAMAAHLAGREGDSARVWTRAHHEFLRLGHLERAVRCAFWLAFGLLDKGELARGGGWIARIQRQLTHGQPDCVEQGYLLFLIALRSIFQGDAATAYATFGDAVKIGERCNDPDLVTWSRNGQGRALIQLGQGSQGMALLDEAMVAVTAGEVSPIIVGDVYCSVIEACQEVFDLHRAQQWTMALSQWCESQPNLVAYRGRCQLYRAEILQLHGAWSDAMDEAQRAHARLSEPPGQPAVGAAFYQQAELSRLRGEFAKAEMAYRQASRFGREPLPGLAQLRMAEGQLEAAVAAIRRALDEADDRVTRCRLLPAYVEIVLALGDVEAARIAADELVQLATELDAPYLHAVSAHAMGAVLVGTGDALAALAPLRQDGGRGRSSTRRTRQHARGFSSDSRVGRSATRTAQIWSWMRPARYFDSCLQPRISPAWKPCSAKRLPKPRAD
jgi:tetratricopeptide (TPR) repeat protein